VKYAVILEKNSWFQKNFWNDYLWFSYVKTLCNELKQSVQNVNVPKIIASLIQTQLTPFHRMYSSFESYLLLHLSVSIVLNAFRKQRIFIVVSSFFL
jgi:hypothetical protein